MSLDVNLGYGDGNVAARGDTVYVVWNDHTFSSYCQKSTDGGQTFGPPVRVNSTPHGTCWVKMDTAGILYATFEYSGDIYFTKSTDGGASFIPALKVSDDTIPTRGQNWPVMAVNNKGQIFIVWNDQRNATPPNYSSVFAAASYDGGLTFTPNVQVNDSLTPSGVFYDVSTDNNGHVYVAWNSTPDLYVSRSDDSGQTFPVRVPSGTGGGITKIAAGDSLVGVTWQVGGNGSIRFLVSYDYGQTFSSEVVVEDSGAINLSELVWKKGIFFISWRGFSPTQVPYGDNENINFSYSRDGGQSFVPFVKSVTSDTAAYEPQKGGHMAVNEEGKVFVVFTDSRYDYYNIDLIWYLFVSVGTPRLVKGDLDFDGITNSRDIALELNAVFFGLSFPAPFVNADCNCDGKLTATDLVILLLNRYLGIPFPCN